MTSSLKRLLLLGCGYTGLALTRLARSYGLTVAATTRRAEHTASLIHAGATPLLLETLSYDVLLPHVDNETALIVSYPPDGTTDVLCAPLARHAFASAYVSSTGVYGNTAGHIDDTTQVSPDTERAQQRLAAEQQWRDVGATVLRSAAIYGPFRGQHERVRSGSARIAGDGSHHICRIHVEDLARALLTCVQEQLGAQTFVIADDLPAAQGEVIYHLAARLNVPTPASVPLEAAPETLRHDRQIDAARFKKITGLSWLYPTYVEGFEACLQAESLH
jgi:hypothetical protein